MKIAFVGASGYGNAGDDTYPLVFKRYFGEHDLLFYNSDLPPSLPDDIRVLFVGGGGILHNVGNQPDSEESSHFKCMKFYMDWAMERNRPYGIISCGFQFRYEGEASYREALAPWIPYLQKARIITLRSRRCAEIARELTGRPDIHFFRDMAYLYAPLATPREEEDILTIVPAGLVNPRNVFTQHLIRLFQTMDYKIVWLSMGSAHDDEEHLIQARELFPHAAIVRASEPAQAFQCIARSRFVYSGRYHGMVFARTRRIPFLVPVSAPYKIVNEDFESPISSAFQHIAMVRSLLSTEE